MREVKISLEDGKATVNIDGIKNYTDLLVCLATLEGVIGGIMEIDKPELREAVDEIQKDLQAKLPEGL